MNRTTTFFLSAFISLTLTAASAAAFAAKGGEGNNTGCNGVGNANSPCAGSGGTTPPTTTPPETTPPVVTPVPGPQGPKGDAGESIQGPRGEPGKNGESIVGATGATGAAGRDAVLPADIVTQGQLNSATQSLREQIDRNSKQASAGTAGALAAASIPQSPEAGKAVIGAGAGAYRSAAAMALGVSYRSTDGKTTSKLFGTVDSQGGAGFGIGAAIQFD